MFNPCKASEAHHLQTYCAFLSFPNISYKLRIGAHRLKVHKNLDFLHYTQTHRHMQILMQHYPACILPSHTYGVNSFESSWNESLRSLQILKRWVMDKFGAIKYIFCVTILHTWISFCTKYRHIKLNRMKYSSFIKYSEFSQLFFVQWRTPEILTYCGLSQLKWSGNWNYYKINIFPGIVLKANVKIYIQIRSVGLNVFVPYSILL